MQKNSLAEPWIKVVLYKKKFFSWNCEKYSFLWLEIDEWQSWFLKTSNLGDWLPCNYQITLAYIFKHDN